MANQPRRLLPSTSGGLLTIDCRSAAAFPISSGYASCPKKSRNVLQPREQLGQAGDQGADVGAQALGEGDAAIAADGITVATEGFLYAARLYRQ